MKLSVKTCGRLIVLQKVSNHFVQIKIHPLRVAFLHKEKQLCENGNIDIYYSLSCVCPRFFLAVSLIMGVCRVASADKSGPCI